MQASEAAGVPDTAQAALFRLAAAQEALSGAPRAQRDGQASPSSRGMPGGKTRSPRLALHLSALSAREHLLLGDAPTARRLLEHVAGALVVWLHLPQARSFNKV